MTEEIRTLIAAAVADRMVVRRAVMDPQDVVYFKGVLEACEGVASVFAGGGGELHVVCPPALAQELDELLSDLGREVDIKWMGAGQGEGGYPRR